MWLSYLREKNLIPSLHPLLSARVQIERCLWAAYDEHCKSVWARNRFSAQKTLSCFEQVCRFWISTCIETEKSYVITKHFQKTSFNLISGASHPVLKSTATGVLRSKDYADQLQLILEQFQQTSSSSGGPTQHQHHQQGNITIY